MGSRQKRAIAHAVGGREEADCCGRLKKTCETRASQNGGGGIYMSRSFSEAVRTQAPITFGNCLLDDLPAEVLCALQPYLHEEPLRAGQPLFESGRRVEQVYFP